MKRRPPSKRSPLTLRRESVRTLLPKESLRNANAGTAIWPTSLIPQTTGNDDPPVA